MEKLDPERRLALAYVPAPRRPAVGALWQLDAALGSVLATGREPMISEIQLAWWRESLDKLDRERPPAEPVLQALAQHVLPAGITGVELAGMEEGWAVLLAPGPLAQAELDLYAEMRGGRLFAFSARLLGAETELVSSAGQVWALADLARRSGNPTEVRAVLRVARDRRVPERWPPALRPLGMLVALAKRDCARGLPLARRGSPARMLRMIGHRITGR